MAFGDHTIQEPSEYAEELERLLHIEDPLAQHNASVELLQRASTARQLTDLPDYDPLIRKIEQLERHAAQRLTQRQPPNE